MEEDRSLHILMLPWLAFGHLLPFLELSKLLARNGHRISFLTTQRNVSRLPSIPLPLVPFITFLELPIPQIDHLPPDAEATVDLPSDDLRPYLRIAYDSFATHISDFLQNTQNPSPDAIIFDYAAHWVPPIAARFGVPCAFLGLHNAAALSFFGPPVALLGGAGARTKPEDFTLPPEWIPFPSAIAYRDFEARELFNPGILPDASGISESHRYAKSIKGCQIVLMRSCKELEPEWLRLLEKLYEKPVIPVGLFPPVIDDQEQHAAVDWLEGKEPGSVVYVSFGSEVKLSVTQVEAIGTGLELSELPFVWVLRAKSVPARVLPRGRGLVCGGWVPQARILAHEAVGGFLTHGGWGSIVEGLAFGRSLVVVPMMFDQALNARNLVEKGMGVEVAREVKGSFTGQEIGRCLRLAMVEEEGEAIRMKARKCRDLFGDVELQAVYVMKLIERLRRLVDEGLEGTS